MFKQRCLLPLFVYCRITGWSGTINFKGSDGKKLRSVSFTITARTKEEARLTSDVRASPGAEIWIRYLQIL